MKNQDFQTRVVQSKGWLSVIDDMLAPLYLLNGLTMLCYQLYHYVATLCLENICKSHGMLQTIVNNIQVLQEQTNRHTLTE